MAGQTESYAGDQSWSVQNHEGERLAKKIAKKAAPKKYSANASGKTVHVKRGDTLRKIAKRYHVKGGWKGLWKLNKKTIKNPNLIYIGQTIKIK